MCGQLQSTHGSAFSDADFSKGRQFEVCSIVATPALEHRGRTKGSKADSEIA
jgi:hypothetical protein